MASLSPRGSLPTYAEVLRAEALRRRLPAWLPRALEPLASLPYGQEIELKEAALEAFLRATRLPVRPSGIRPSPQPRGYRATSKRRVMPRQGRVVLAVNREDPAHGGFTQSALEPQEHAALFRALAGALNQSELSRTAARLSWVILRGSARGTAVIFNAARSDERIVNGLLKAVEQAAATAPRPCGVWLFVDPSRSDYYLESGSGGGPVPLQRLSGDEALVAGFEGREYLFTPGVFSQVNPSIVPAMLAEARRLTGSGGRLWDLYCGYGLFAIALSQRFASIVGVEASAEAVACARANVGRRSGPGALAGCVFHDLRITGPALAALFAVTSPADESMILDPPYGGAPAPVILAAGARGARRIVHVFCNTGRIPADAAIWRKAGYRISEIVPLDMFPGTPELETLVCLEPGEPGEPHEPGAPPRQAPFAARFQAH